MIIKRNQTSLILILIFFFSLKIKGRVSSSFFFPQLFSGMKLFYFQFFFFLFLFPVRFIDLRRIKVSLIIHPYRQRWDAQWFLWFSLYCICPYIPQRKHGQRRNKLAKPSYVFFFYHFIDHFSCWTTLNPPCFSFLDISLLSAQPSTITPPPIYFVWKEEELFLCWSSSLRVGEENQLVPPLLCTIFFFLVDHNICGPCSKSPPKKKSPPLSFLSFSKSSLFFLTNPRGVYL